MYPIVVNVQSLLSCIGEYCAGSVLCFVMAMSQLIIELFVQRALRYRGVHNEINGIQNVDGFD